MRMKIFLMGVLGLLVSGCSASALKNMPPAETFKSETRLPIDGVWNLDKSELHLESGVLYYSSTKDDAAVNKAIITNITNNDNSSYHGTCFDYKEKKYDISCRLLLVKQKTLVVVKGSDILCRLSLVKPSDDDMYKSAEDVATRTTAQLNKHLKCSRHCSTELVSCLSGCTKNVSSSMYKNKLVNSVNLMNQTFCNGNCKDDKRACTEQCVNSADFF